MHWAKVLIVVVGSAWFIPVSCAVSLYTGIHLNAEIDARDVSKGDSVHSLFSMVIDSGGNGDSFLVVKMDDLRHYQELIQSDSTNTLSFLMPKSSGRQSSSRADYSYRVLDKAASEQIIEVVEAYHDGDNTIWSRYRATHSTITPISSRMLYFGYMFAAFPYAFVFSFLLYAAGRYFKRRIPTPRAVNVDS